MKVQVQSPIAKSAIYKYQSGDLHPFNDHIAVEAALEINLQSKDKLFPLSITMRTPGEDHYLAIGYLFTEEIISSRADIIGWRQLAEHISCIELAHHVELDLSHQSRQSYASSSCGVCGKTSMDMIRTTPTVLPPLASPIVNLKILGALPQKLYSYQSMFNQTGGNHAAAIFNQMGQLLFTAEDVGRHNALDKLIGRALLEGYIPLSNHILLLSGRISFELVQKAVMAGIAFIAAIGAPSTAAIELAREYGVTLIGFLKENSFNLYTGKYRVLVDSRV